MTKMPVRINNEQFVFSSSDHNKLQKEIITGCILLNQLLQ